MLINNKNIYKDDVTIWNSEFPFLSKETFINGLNDCRLNDRTKKLLIESFIENLQEILEELKK